MAYYDQWSIYQNAFYLKNVDNEGIAGKLDYMLYDFANVDPTNLTCFEANKAASQDENDPNAGDGAGDSFADYQKSFGSDISVDGTADVWNQPIVGNFHQLQELKARHPNLKVLLSIGGWTYSKFFSDAAASDAARKKLVSSCINMFIKGNLPVQGGYGGDGTAKGIFDGSTSTGNTRAVAATPATTPVPPTSRTSPRCWPNSGPSSTRRARRTVKRTR
ncbi:glycosyl hydrolase family 18 protein [Fodinicola feengrottensis]|uniref:glycosyl hydrolase family 18 protein n=1 Tax=Fodinicola feengrottensis TaxID=435914 RepID=UPI0024425AD4|nr:glycosyl hydrolase family 18 protein [Fodinicola feengrottensis]